MFNKKSIKELQEEVCFLQELNGVLLEKLGLEIDFCENCGDVILNETEE